MKQSRNLFSGFLVIVIVLAVSGQAAPPEAYDRASAKARVDALSGQLRFSDAAGKRVYDSLRDQVTRQIHNDIDGYIEHSVDPAASDATVRSDLGDILSQHRYNPEYSTPVFASVGANGCLVIGYMLVRGGGAVNDSDVAVRAYRVVAGHYELADATGSDMDGYGFFMQQLPSPLSGQAWFLIWGQLSGYNGNRTRFRVYAFDGAKFRTVWSPDDFLNASVDVTASGFSIKHLDRARYDALQPPYGDLDEYIPFGDGIRRVSTQVVPQ